MIKFICPCCGSEFVKVEQGDNSSRQKLEATRSDLEIEKLNANAKREQKSQKLVVDGWTISFEPQYAFSINGNRTDKQGRRYFKYMRYYAKKVIDGKKHRIYIGENLDAEFVRGKIAQYLERWKGDSYARD